MVERRIMHFAGDLWILPGFDEEHFFPRERQSARQRSAPRAGAHDDVIKR